MGNFQNNRYGFRLKEKESSANKKKDDRLKKREWPGLILNVVGLVVVGLYLLGFGIALSVENAFSLHFASLFGTSLELIELSFWAVVEFGRADFDFWEMINPIKNGQIISILAFFVAFVILIILIPRRQRVKETAKSWKERWNAWRKSESDKAAMGFMALTFSGLSFLVTLAPAIIAIILSFAWAFSLILPLIGMSFGNNIIKEYVIEPVRCTPLSDRKTRLDRYTARELAKAQGKVIGKGEKTVACLHIYSHIGSGDKDYGAGRKVFATSSSIILFDPKTGKVWRAPGKDTIIETVEKL